jgi:Tol biopolymer transport system component
MKNFSRVILALIVGSSALWLLASSARSPAAQDSEVQYQRAVQLETIEGNLNAAIDLYKQVINNNGHNRALAAKALLRLGGCYEKLGQEEARKTYQQLIRDYPDQQGEVKLAYSRLAALTPGTAKDSGIVTRQVWSGPEVGFSGRPSPDGRYLSFSDSTGNLAIRELATGETRRLTTDASLWTAEGWAGWSLFSPDGRRLVYEWGQWDSWLRLSSLDGSETRVLLPAKRDWWLVPCDWSSDGRYILIHYYSAGKREPSQIAVIAVTDGSLRVVKTLDPGQPVNGRNMWFSPDGRYIVFDVLPSGAQNNRDLAVVSVDGKLEYSLVKDPADDYVLGWSTVSRRFLYPRGNRMVNPVF